MKDILLTIILTLIVVWLTHLTVAFARTRRKKGHFRGLFSRKSKVGTKDLLYQTLKKIHIDPQTDEEERICFTYEKSNFVIEASNEALIISIWNVWWSGLEINDTDIPKIKEAINLTNMENTVMTFYSIDEEKNILGLHSKYDMILSAYLPDNETILKAILDTFLKAQQDVYNNFQKLNSSEDVKTVNERVKIKGFRR